MIIKGLFRRYERWNPVHPTCGAFWGMGVGVGCGVGWGPGFGPEVVGYVGAGCGVGFSVGFTIAGLGIGLPANYLFHIPYNAVVAQRNGAFGFTESNLAWDGWNNFASRISVLQRAADERISSYKRNNFLERRIELREMKSKLSACVKSFPDVLKTSFSRVFLPPGKV